MIFIYPHWQSNWLWSAGSLPFLGDNRWVMQLQVSQESSRGLALADTQRSPGPSLGQFGQSCQSTTCQIPLTAEITAVRCSAEETAAEMQEWFPCTPWMWHRPRLNAAPLCWAGANKRSQMMRVPHSSVKAVVWNSPDQSKRYLDFLDKWPDWQTNCKWQTEEIICTGTAVGHREDDEFWGAEAGGDLSKSSDITPKEH